MKQIILTALFAVIMLSVYGCADDGEKNGSTSSGNTGAGNIGTDTNGNTGAGNIGTDTNPIDLNTYNCAYDSYRGGYKLTNTQIDSEIAKKYPMNIDVVFYDNRDTWGELTKKYNIYYAGDRDGTKYVIVEDTTLNGVLKDYFYFFNTANPSKLQELKECAGINNAYDITPECINAVNNAGYLDKLAYTVDMDKLKTNCSK